MHSLRRLAAKATPEPKYRVCPWTNIITGKISRWSVEIKLHLPRYFHLRAGNAPCLFDTKVEAEMFMDFLKLNKGWWK